MDHKIKERRFTDHTMVRSDIDDKWSVTVTNNGFQWWGIATLFPTELGAQTVALAIELALKAQGDES
jgi:hypothetical protein